jgi:hypothetical protein
MLLPVIVLAACAAEKSKNLQTQVLLVCYLWETLTLTVALGAIIHYFASGVRVVSGPPCNSLNKKGKRMHI